MSSSGTYAGTIFIIAKYRKPGKLAFAAATAEHIFKELPPNENIHWAVEKYDWDGKKVESLDFKSNLETTGNSPIRANLKSDIGLLFLPKMKTKVQPLRVINPNFAQKPGIKVAWAGFPEFSIRKTQEIYPCYFEGVISATVNRVQQDGKLYYLVDGHGGKGISGGPLWCWNEDLNNYEVIGICSQYLNSGELDGAPGLIVFESVNPVVRYINTSNELEMNIVG